jgi:hypothetical protein
MLSFSLVAKSRKIVALGKLTRFTAVGGESMGWRIELSPVITADGKQISIIEVKVSNTKWLEALENKTVRAKGTLTYTTGPETGERPVLDLACSKDIKEKKQSFLDTLSFFLEAL